MRSRSVGWLGTGRLTLLALVLAGCSPATAPAPGAEVGRYVATAVAGRPVPGVTDSSAREFGVLLADTLELDGRGGAQRAFAVRRIDRALGTDTVYRVRVAAAYRRSGATRLEVGTFAACPPNALCVANDTGTVAGGRVTLVSFHLPGPPLVVLDRVAP